MMILKNISLKAQHPPRHQNKTKDVCGVFCGEGCAEEHTPRVTSDSAPTGCHLSMEREREDWVVFLFYFWEAKVD